MYLAVLHPLATGSAEPMTVCTGKPAPTLLPVVS